MLTAPPIFTAKPSEQPLILPEGGTLTLTCAFENTPSPRVQWFIPRGIHFSRVRNKTNGGVSVLTVWSLRSSDSGEFACTGRNDFGYAQATTTVKIPGEIH